MKVKELYTMDFNDACEKLAGEIDIITTYESLKDFAIHMIQEDHLYLAMHILEAIHKAPADYYDYDYTMGTLEDPTPLTLTFDLLDYCDDGEDTYYGIYYTIFLLVCKEEGVVFSRHLFLRTSLLQCPKYTKA